MKRVLLVIASITMMLFAVPQRVAAQKKCGNCSGASASSHKSQHKKADPPKNNDGDDNKPALPPANKNCGKDVNRAKAPCTACEIASVHSSCMEAPYDGFIKVFWFTKGPCTKTPIVTGLPAGVGFSILYDDNNRPYINVGPFKGVGCTMNIVFNNINTGDPVTRQLPITAQQKPDEVDVSAVVSPDDDTKRPVLSSPLFWIGVGVAVLTGGYLFYDNNRDLFCGRSKNNNPPPNDPPLNNSTGQQGVNGHDPGGNKRTPPDENPSGRSGLQQGVTAQPGGFVIRLGF